MHFRLEKHLRDTLCKNWINRFDDNCSSVYRVEVPVGRLVPDVVIVKTNTKPRHDLWPKGFSYQHSVIVWLLRSFRKLRLKTIADKVYDNPDRTERLISPLLKSGALDKNGNGAYFLSEELLNLDAKVISVEVKLKRWRDALKQAKEYKEFSDMSIVAMDASIATGNTPIRNHFISEGIGLYAVSRESASAVIAERSKEVSHPYHDYLVASAFGKTNHTRWSCL